MGTKSNPGKYDCYDKAEPDEPMFILLARDRSFEACVRKWIKKRRKLMREGFKPPTDQLKIDEAYEAIVAARRWRREHR